MDEALWRRLCTVDCESLSQAFLPSPNLYPHLLLCLLPAVFLPVALITAASVDLVSFHTATFKSAVAECDETQAATSLQSACAEVYLDKASLFVKADVGRLGGGGAMRAVLTKATPM